MRKELFTFGGMFQNNRWGNKNFSFAGYFMSSEFTNQYLPKELLSPL